MKTNQYTKIQDQEIYIVRGGGVTGICEKGPLMMELMREIIQRGGIPTYQIWGGK